jgi:predicted nucleotidyltransferase
MRIPTLVNELNLNPHITNHIIECLGSVKNILGENLLGVYLYGSLVAGGFQKYSDIDIFVVCNRATTLDEKKQLVSGLLAISGIYMKSKKAPIEMTIVEKSAINPWHYPPLFDFQYGEWLRTKFEQGIIEPWPTKEMPDLALLITQVLLASKPLVGPEASQLLCKVPYTDFISALQDALPHLMDDIASDTRNVLLTLARIWSTVETDAIRSKPAAADWAINHLPNEYRFVMERAKAICIGQTKEQWDDIRHLIKHCAEFITCEIHNKMSEIMISDHKNRSIKLA